MAGEELTVKSFAPVNPYGRDNLTETRMAFVGEGGHSLTLMRSSLFILRPPAPRHGDIHWRVTIGTWLMN